MHQEKEKAAQLRQSLLERSDYESSSSEFVMRKDGKKRPSSEWFMFDNLSTQQSEDLLRQHGSHCYYLVSHFLDPSSYQLTIRFDEEDGSVFKHYSVRISAKKFVLDGLDGSFTSIKDVITAVEANLDMKLIPLFYEKMDCESCEFDLSESIEIPPDYVPAKNYPEAPRRPLPVIVPIRPTLRRLQLASTRDRTMTQSEREELQPTDYRNKGCCWRLWHTDPAGKWYKPHKAGPCAAALLVFGWIWFLLLFGWIILLALLLVGVLVSCAYVLNFLCTGRCSIDDDDE